jgi:hypothetical protein
MTIDIGTKINMQDLLQSRMLIQANSGGGKSVLARVIIEQTFEQVPFIVLDIEGEYYTLKEKFGDILVIGGQHADIPISMKSVKLLPKEIIANRLSVIIDVSDLQMNERILYSKYFIETMMDLPKEYWINYLVFVEEAHKLCGEQDKQASATAIKDLMSRGRKRGYCGILLTQRISKLHKDAAAECNNKFIGKTFLDIDIDRAAKELGWSASADKNILRTLKPGCFYAFGTSIVPNHVHEVSIKQPQTKIVKAGANLDIKPQKPTEKIKLALAKLNELPQDAEKELKTIQQLQAEVNKLKAATTNKQEIVKMQMDLNIALKRCDEYNKLVDKLAQRIIDIRKIASLPIEGINVLPQSTELNDQHLLPFQQRRENLKKVYDGNPIVFQRGRYPGEKLQAETKKDFAKLSSNGSLPPGEKKILIAAAQYPNGVTREQLTILTAYKRSSRDAYIQRLKEKNYLKQDGARLFSTDEGVALLGNDFEPLPTGEKLREYWLNKLPRGEASILEILLDAYPHAVRRDDITEKTTYQRSSRDAYLQRMAAKEIVTIVDRGEVKASDNLFMDHSLNN